MTLNEAFVKLLKGEKVTYPGLDGYVILKDDNLVTELDFEKSFKRKDWQSVKSEPEKVKEDKKKSGPHCRIHEYVADRQEIREYINDMLNDFIKGFKI